MKKFLTTAALFLYAGIAFAAVDLNSATVSQLEKVNGIGPKKAEAIVQYRTQHHGFKNVSELQSVKGIGHGKIFQKVKGEFVVNGSSTQKPTPSPIAMKGMMMNKGANTATAQPVTTVKK